MNEDIEAGDNEEFLLDLISKNLSQKEIRKRLDAHKKKKKIRIEKGERSGKFAAKTIKAIEMVKEVVILPADSKKNRREGKDLEVTIFQKKARLHFGRTFMTQRVWVQVKTTDNSVDDFRRTNGRTEEERDQRLAERRLIVLNGRTSEERITKSFIRQLDFIDKYLQQSK